MTQVEESTFHQFCVLSQKLQNLQEAVRQGNITPIRREELHVETEQLHTLIDQFKLETSITQTHALEQFSHIESDVISLYREIEDGFEDYEITLISKEALELGTSIESNKMTRVAKVVDELKHNILYLFKHRRPSLAHRKIVHLAMKMVDHAKSALSGKELSCGQHIQLVQLLKHLLAEAIVRADQVASGSESELVMDLYEIIELLYEKKRGKALALFRTIKHLLTPAQARRAEAALDSEEELMQALLEIADGDPCYEWTVAECSGSKVESLGFGLA